MYKNTYIYISTNINKQIYIYILIYASDPHWGHQTSVKWRSTCDAFNALQQYTKINLRSRCELASFYHARLYICRAPWHAATSRKKLLGPRTFVSWDVRSLARGIPCQQQTRMKLLQCLHAVLLRSCFPLSPDHKHKSVPGLHWPGLGALNAMISEHIAQTF